MNSKSPTSILNRVMQLALILSAAATVLMTGEREVHIKGSCEAVAVSPERAKALEAAGFKAAVLCRPTRLADLVPTVAGDIISALLGGAFPQSNGTLPSGRSPLPTSKLDLWNDRRRPSQVRSRR